MSERAPRATGDRVLRAMQRAGWQVVRHRSSHVQMKHPERPGRITIPLHAGEVLHPKTLDSILRQAGMTVAERIELL